MLQKKTTLMRTINRIIELDRGTIRLNGDLLSERHFSMMGSLPIERGLFKSITAYEYIALLV
jgi:ABC-type uncharacterized transport system ATPase subunit